MKDVTLSVQDEYADQINAALADPTQEVMYIFVPFDKRRPLDESEKNKLVNEAASMARELLRQH